MRFVTIIVICLVGSGLVATPVIHDAIVAANAYYALGMRHGQVPDAVPAYTKHDWAMFPVFLVGLATLGVGVLSAIRELARPALARSIEA